jgi:hypothetical protein
MYTYENLRTKCNERVKTMYSGTDYTPPLMYRKKKKKKKKLRGFGPRANYADGATAACWRSSANFCG